MSIAQLGTGKLNGAFFEAQNIAADHPDVVMEMAKVAMAWHREVGPEHPGSSDRAISKATAGCEQWPFPGL